MSADQSFPLNAEFIDRLPNTFAGTNGGDTLTTAAQIVGCVYTLSGGSTSTITTPSAAVIVAGIPNCQVGDTFMFVVNNGGSGTATLAAGSGVTMPSVKTVTTLLCKNFMGVVTNATAGSEAVIFCG